VSRPGDRDHVDEATGEPREIVLHEEELEIGRERQELGTVRARKRIDTERVEQVAERGIEHADVERTGPMQGDTGEVITLEDGSISVPILEEELVVTKRVVVRERVIVRKHTVTEEHRVTAEVRKERLEIDADPNVRVVDER
jgi:uncharacterized protein (TIGR02271 family)